MEKVWLKSYPHGVPHTVDTARYSSIYSFFTAVCHEHGHKVAYEHEGIALTYAQLQQRVERFAAYCHKMGIRKGDRVALMMPNLLHYPIAMYACMKLGAIVVNINPLYTASELKNLLSDAKPSMIVVFDHFLETLRDAGVQDMLVVTAGYADFMSPLKQSLINFVLKYIKRLKKSVDFKCQESFRQALQAKRSIKSAAVSLGDCAFLQYTGGTTGVPKAAMLSHGNLLANVQQVHAWFAPLVTVGKEVLITALPLYHIFSLMVNGLLFLKFGGKNILITNPRDIPGMIATMKDSQFTGMIGVNALFNGLVHNSAFKSVDFSHCHLAIAGGAALTQRVADKWKTITGTPLLEGYGLTETSPVVCVDPLEDYEFNGSIGLPMPSTDIKLVDEEGNEVGFDQPGELCIKGPQVMQGYWRNTEETTKVLSADGWLKTGDIAQIDQEGFVCLIDRKKEMILVSGFNVYPSEVEAVILQLDGVKEVAVLGVPNTVSGERVVAFVVRENESITSEMVQQHCREKLTNYKIPRRIKFVKELPKTPIGKVSKKLIHEKYGGKI